MTEVRQGLIHLSFGLTCCIIRDTTQPGKQWDIGRELRRRIKERFEQEGIEMPYPQYEIRMRQ